MDRAKVAKNGVLLNTVLIAVALIIWGAFFVLNNFGSAQITFFVWIVYMVVAAVLLVLSILTFIQLQKNNIKGGALLLASAIVMMVFSVFAFVIGLITIILSGLSMRKIKESQQEMEFKEELAAE
ncbi:hypothetical protein [Culicoidibacter larvae]|uniref:DUF4064 domain-containing protein n=1 Tax=Culicoidibacter larvae TaxID=2579976 RepID=A0A5R8Q8Z0_9FIRM|nr:hypothetical protein [Culicoidibacter larvae]TLG71753.1 hypothetical protein FEZ08_10105 [Culicoidibacter larvae]